MGNLEYDTEKARLRGLWASQSGGEGWDSKVLLGGRAGPSGRMGNPEEFGRW